jgi:uridine kinase
MTSRRLRASDLSALVGLVRERSRGFDRPYVVAIDGRSGVGKSTLAARLSGELDATVIDGDDFFRGGVELRNDAPSDRARDCIGWALQRPILEALRAGRDGRYFAFDWDAFDGSLATEPTSVVARTFVVIEGVYSARPELHDLIDLRVLVQVPDATRLERLLAREGAIGPWERQWHEAEVWYFEHAAPPSSFDVLVDG